MSKAKNEQKANGAITAISPKTESAAPAEKNVLSIAPEPGEDAELALVKVRLHPVFTAATTMRNFERQLAEHDIGALIKELGRHVTDVKAGNMNRAEAMLMSQANTLDAIFNALAQRAGANVGTHRDTAEIYLRMALKAQSQCRTTLETLAEIKAPRSTQFIKQQNVASQQQVNNGAVTNGGIARAHEKNSSQSNELLEAQDGERLDTGTTGTASSIDQQLAAVGAVDRTANKGRQGAQQ